MRTKLKASKKSNKSFLVTFSLRMAVIKTLWLHIAFFAQQNILHFGDKQCLFIKKFSNESTIKLLGKCSVQEDM